MEPSSIFHNVPQRSATSPRLLQRPAFRKSKAVVNSIGKSRRTFLKQGSSAGIAALAASAWTPLPSAHADSPSPSGGTIEEPSRPGVKYQVLIETAQSTAITIEEMEEMEVSPFVSTETGSSGGKDAHGGAVLRTRFSATTHVPGSPEIPYDFTKANAGSPLPAPANRAQPGTGYDRLKLWSGQFVPREGAGKNMEDGASLEQIFVVSANNDGSLLIQVSAAAVDRPSDAYNGGKYGIGTIILGKLSRREDGEGKTIETLDLTCLSAAAWHHNFELFPDKISDLENDDIDLDMLLRLERDNLEGPPLPLLTSRNSSTLNVEKPQFVSGKSVSGPGLFERNVSRDISIMQKLGQTTPEFVWFAVKEKNDNAPPDLSKGAFYKVSPINPPRPELPTDTVRAQPPNATRDFALVRTSIRVETFWSAGGDLLGVRPE